MATQQERLLALARSVAAARAEDPAIEAILLTGSVAQGRADGVSDVDMMLYYRELPTPERFEELKEAALASGGGIYGYDPAEGMACYHFFDGVKVDFGHGTSAELEERLDGFLEKPDVKDTTTQIVMSGVATGLPLHGAEKLRGWQERLRHLPESYWEEVVKGHSNGHGSSGLRTRLRTHPAGPGPSAQYLVRAEPGDPAGESEGDCRERGEVVRLAGTGRRTGRGSFYCPASGGCGRIAVADPRNPGAG